VLMNSLFLCKQHAPQQRQTHDATRAALRPPDLTSALAWRRTPACDMRLSCVWLRLRLRCVRRKAPCLAATGHLRNCHSNALLTAQRQLNQLTVT
jgi:hypothetical protein